MTLTLLRKSSKGAGEVENSTQTSFELDSEQIPLHSFDPDDKTTIQVINDEDSAQVHKVIQGMVFGFFCNQISRMFCRRYFLFVAQLVKFLIEVLFMAVFSRIDI